MANLRQLLSSDYCPADLLETDCKQQIKRSQNWLTKAWLKICKARNFLALVVA